MHNTWTQTIAWGRPGVGHGLDGVGQKERTWETSVILATTK